MRFLVALGIVWLLAPAPAHADGGGFPVTATAYTCEDVPHNPMNAPGMCVVLANGSRDVFSAGIACPRAWMGRAYEVPGWGVLVCDDTGAHDTWHGLPHIDIRVSTYEAAREWGTRTITITPVEASGGFATPVQPVVRSACPRYGHRCSDDPAAHWQGVARARVALVAPARLRPLSPALLLREEYLNGPTRILGSGRN